MKRFLSWVVLIACYLAFGLILNLDMMLLKYILGLYSSLGTFLKIVVLLLGGTTILGLAVAPLWYGIPLMKAASEKVYPSKNGLRYTVFGIYVIIASLCEAIMSFAIRDIFFLILGVALIWVGNGVRKDYKDQLTKESSKVESPATNESEDQPTIKLEAQRTNSRAYSNVKPVGDIIPGPLVKPENLDRAQQAINEAMLETREESKEKAVSVVPASISKSELEPNESQPELKPEIDTLPVNELKLLKELYDDGVITENEFSEKKKMLLGL